MAARGEGERGKAWSKAELFEGGRIHTYQSQRYLSRRDEIEGRVDEGDQGENESEDDIRVIGSEVEMVGPVEA